jgi:hypothetical protein
MQNWAIESENLIKKFPQRSQANSNKSNGTAKEKKSLRLSWPFRKGEASPLFTAVDGVTVDRAR